MLIDYLLPNKIDIELGTSILRTFIHNTLVLFRKERKKERKGTDLLNLLFWLRKFYETIFYIQTYTVTVSKHGLKIGLGLTAGWLNQQPIIT